MTVTHQAHQRRPWGVDVFVVMVCDQNQCRTKQRPSSFTVCDLPAETVATCWRCGWASIVRIRKEDT